MPHWQPAGIGRGLGQDLRDRVALLPAHGHEDARHEREVERHVALVAADRGVAEVLDHVRGPLVGLGQQHLVRVELVDLGPDPLQVLVRLLEVLAVGALALVQVGHRVQPEAVDAQVQPEPQHLDHRVLHARVLEVQVRLVGEEPVPVVLAADRVEGPVGGLGVDEDDPRPGVLVVGVGPDVEVPVRPVGIRARRLEPGVLVRRVVHDQVGDDPDAALVRLVDQRDEVPDVPVLGQHGHEVGDVVAAVAQRGLVDGQQPQAVDAEPLQVVQLRDQAAQVAGAVAVGILETPDEHLVEHRALVPLRVARLVRVERVGYRLVVLCHCRISWSCRTGRHLQGLTKGGSR